MAESVLSRTAPPKRASHSRCCACAGLRPRGSAPPRNHLSWRTVAVCVRPPGRQAEGARPYLLARATPAPEQTRQRVLDLTFLCVATSRPSCSKTPTRRPMTSRSPAARALVWPRCSSPHLRRAPGGLTAWLSAGSVGTAGPAVAVPAPVGKLCPGGCRRTPTRKARPTADRSPEPEGVRAPSAACLPWAGQCGSSRCDRESSVAALLPPGTADRRAPAVGWCLLWRWPPRLWAGWVPQLAVPAGTLRGPMP